MYVSVQKPDGTTERCIIKTRDRIEILEREARVIGALAEFGVPVPTVLAGPANITDESGMYAAIVLNELPGQSLPWLGTTSLAEADFTCRLLIQGLNTFHQLRDSQNSNYPRRVLHCP
jgi:aminoglycoside phosphotransferase